MAVEKKRRAGGKFIYVVSFVFEGKKRWLKVGPYRRQAEVKNREIKEQIKNGTFDLEFINDSSNVTLAEYGQQWLSKRTNVHAEEDRNTFRRYVLSKPWLCDLKMTEVKAKHADRFIAELRESGLKGKGLSDSTIDNTIGPIRQIFNAAVRAEICISNPFSIPRGLLKKAPDKEKEIYTVDEIKTLLTHPEIDLPYRVLIAIYVYSGMRKGEAVSLKWEDLALDSPFLPCLRCRGQYDGERATKTKVIKMHPVHPELLAILLEWRDEHFEKWIGHKPEPGDYIVPNHTEQRKVEHHTGSTIFGRLKKDCKKLGVRALGVHTFRHNFITFARRGGARQEIIRKITHSSRNSIVDRYTHFDWQPLCEAVLCFSLNCDAHRNTQRDLGNAGYFGVQPSTQIAGYVPDNTQFASSDSLFKPRHSPQNSAEISCENKTRRKTRRSKSDTTGDNLTPNEVRLSRLSAFAEADEKGARPGLAVCRGLDAAIRIGQGEDAWDELQGYLKDAAEAVGS